MTTVRNIGIAFGLTLLSAMGVFVLLAALGPDWAQYAPATCTATRCFCEFPRTGALILQPANSWSSYGYAFVGLLMIVVSRTAEWRSGFHRDAAAFFGITAILVGLGSVLLHATLSLWGQFLDVTGMYFTSGFMLVSALTRWRNLGERQAVALYVVLLTLLLALLYAVPEVRRWLFAVVLIAALVAELAFARPKRPGIRVRYYLIGIALKAVAFMIWNLDQHGVVCAPRSLLQGHAAWHLLGATSLWFTFLYYRSEHPRPVTSPEQ